MCLTGPAAAGDSAHSNNITTNTELVTFLNGFKGINGVQSNTPARVE